MGKPLSPCLKEDNISAAQISTFLTNRQAYHVLNLTSQHQTVRLCYSEISKQYEKGPLLGGLRVLVSGLFLRTLSLGQADIPNLKKLIRERTHKRI